MMSNFIMPMVPRISSTASEPCPLLANAAAETIASVEPFSTTDTSGWVPTRLARNGSRAR